MSDAPASNGASSTLPALARLRCVPATRHMPRLGDDETAKLLAELQDWQRNRDAIEKTFTFAGFGQTMAFVNAISWIARREDHHPDLTVSYDRCRVVLSTHAVGGLTRNDFICAAKIDVLFAL